MSNLPPPPPPPPPSEYTSSGGSSLSVGEALSRGWAAFVDRLAQFAIIALALAVIQGLLSIPALGLDDDNPSGALVALVVGLSLLSVVVSVIFSAFQTRLALAAVDGTPRSLGEVFQAAMERIWSYIGWGLLAAIIVGVGFLLCVVPLFIAAFFLMFVPFLAIEGRSRPDPLTGSFNAVKEQAGNLILLFLVFLALGLVAAALFFALSFIPFLGGVISGLVWALFFSFALCTLAVVYRSSAVGSRRA